MKRRQFLSGIIAAPVVITTPGLLMPVKPLPADIWTFEVCNEVWNANYLYTVRSAVNAFEFHTFSKDDALAFEVSQ